MKIYELQPVNGRKSFYGKALVKVEDNGTETLYSYNTPIISRSITDELKRLWGRVESNNGNAYKSVLRIE